MSVEGGPGPEFLSEKYGDLTGSKPVERAVIKARGEGESVRDNKHDRIDAYMDRLEGVSDDERKFSLLENKILNRFTLNAADEETVEKVAEGLYESEKRIAVERGQGGVVKQFESTRDIMEHYKPLVLEKAEIQRKTLSSWLDYLQENDAKHPMWFRYFAVRNLEKMGMLDKEKMTYSKRTPTTVAAFPELNSEALGWVYKRLNEGVDENEFPTDLDHPEFEQKKKNLEQLIKAKDFPKLYAFALVETAGKLNRESVDGEWRKYDQGSDFRILEGDLKSKGTGWCTAEGSAENQLQGGDFYVYYTKGQNDQYSEPRVAIRMEGDQVGEVRGVNHRQELEPELINVAQEQYHSMPGGESYDKKAFDMKEVTVLVKKQEKGEEFTKDDLIFLYEINASIEGFGYEKDERIEKLRKDRDPKTDVPIVFECDPEQIAFSQNEVNENTKAYVGPLFPGIFTKLANLEHIYTSFPEGKIHRSELEIGGKTAEELEQELRGKNINIGDYAKDMLHSPDFTTLANPEQIDLVKLKVRDLGFTNYATTDQLYARAEELGLELCPAEVGLYQRLEDTEQLLGDWYRIAMKQIADRRGDPCVFRLLRRGGGLWLSRNWTFPAREWYPDDELMFRLRKVSSET